MEDNPLNDFVELPEGCSKLKYSNIICGVIRGALDMVRAVQRCAYKSALSPDTERLPSRST